MLRSIPGWRALHPSRHPICPAHFPAQEGRQREEGRRNQASRTCNRVAATVSCRRHTGRARTGAMQSLLHQRRHVPGQSVSPRRLHGELAPQAGQDGKKKHSGSAVKKLVTPHSLTPPTLLPHRTRALPLCRGGMRWAGSSFSPPVWGRTERRGNSREREGEKQRLPW